MLKSFSEDNTSVLTLGHRLLRRGFGGHVWVSKALLALFCGEKGDQIGYLLNDLGFNSRTIVSITPPPPVLSL
jgi:hypothetical protein